MLLHDIYALVSGLGHPEYPLLNAGYSPGSAMPVVDFSPTIKNLLLSDDWNTIHELLTELNHDHKIADAAVKTFREFQIDTYLQGSDEVLAELIAILILVYRIPHSGHPDNTYWLTTSFFQNTLSCAHAQITDEAKTVLLERLTKDIAEQRRETGRTDLRNPLMYDLERLDESPPASSVCQRLAAIPVTSRTVVFDAMTRNFGHAPIRRLRPELYYGERQFGNNTEWNVHYIQWANIFIAPPDDTDITKLLSKDKIRVEAEKRDIDIPQSYSRARMLNQIREVNGDAYANLFREATKNSAIVNPELEKELNEVLRRRDNIEYACRALAAI